MGFDLSGVNPKINKNISAYKHYSPDIEIWNSKDEKVRKRFYEDMDKYHNDNPGIYFRNNVWWWRPLWDFVCMHCEFMTDEQKMSGAYNDGKLIDQETAAKIGTKLEILLEDGTVKRWEKHIKTRNEDLAKDNDKDKRFMSNYPFSQDNVENFSKFCLESGGFEIC